MQTLQLWTEAFMAAITQSARRMPFSMRFLARETLLAMQARFPEATQDFLAVGVGRLVYYRFLNPAIV
jgi:Ras GTPase-activating-like protein IQGAP2/3